jgi:conjugative relaxase-like TrwC/TraI family protein
VLTVKKVPSATAGSYADYLEGKTVATQMGDYYLKDGERIEAPGRWVQGAGAIGANPDRPVGAEVLRELMAVRHPRTGEALRPAGASGEKVAALDATFSAPKSVSAVWAVADPDLRQRIEQAHETAIDRALAYAAQEVPLARRRLDRDTVTHIRVAHLLASSWRHTTARAVDGRAPDPQLHSHVLLHAAVRRDGKLVAIDSRALLTHRRELGAAYRTELAHELAGLGFEVERGTGQGGRYFEIAGVPQLLLDVWSSRHRQVQEAIRQRLERSGRQTLTAAEERLMAVSTRAGKQPVTNADLDRQWHTAAREHRFGPLERAELRDQVPRPLRPVDVDVVGGALTEFDATFTRTQARAVALEQNAGVPIRHALHALGQMRADHELLTLDDGRLTTRRHRQWELETVDSLGRTSVHRVTPLPPEMVQAEAQTLDARLAESGGRLTDEQRRTIELATGDRQLVVIEGQAGSGKSTVLQAVARVHQDWGQQVILTSTGALAAERLDDELAQAGVVALAFSTAALEQAIRNGRIELTPHHTIIHDEAALASTRELRPLLAQVEESGARLILVGDPHQNQPVGAGGLWPYIERAAHGSSAHVALTGNVRARDAEDRRDQLLFRNGEHTRALQGYAARGHVHIHDEQASAEDAALEAAHTDREAGLRTVVIAQTSNQHLDELNARVQAIRLQNHELGSDAVAVPGRPYQLHRGDEVQIRKTTETRDAGWIRNGASGQVTAVDAEKKTARLHLGDDRDVTLTQTQLSEADVRLAYVQHPFPAQGITSDTAHFIAGENATGAGSYVGLTRARERTDIYGSRQLLDGVAGTDDIDRLAQDIGSQEPEAASIEQPLRHETAVGLEPLAHPEEGHEMGGPTSRDSRAHRDEWGLSWDR